MKTTTNKETGIDEVYVDIGRCKYLLTFECKDKDCLTKFKVFTSREKISIKEFSCPICKGTVNFAYIEENEDFGTYDGERAVDRAKELGLIDDEGSEE